jgi:hypothetical protein
VSAVAPLLLEPRREDRSRDLGVDGVAAASRLKT